MSAFETTVNDIRSGAVLALPIVLGYFPLATAYGVLAQQAGISVVHTVMMSVIVYAGASQFMAVNMLGLGAGGMEIILAAFMVNIRHIVLSMSLLQRLKHLSLPRQVGAFLGTTDETFALLSFAQKDRLLTPGLTIGIMATAYSSWVLGSIVGAVLGAAVPVDWAASMSVALYAMFVALLVPGLQSKPRAWTISAAAALICTVLTPLLGSGWAIAAGTVGGGAAGMLQEMNQKGL